MGYLVKPILRGLNCIMHCSYNAKMCAELKILSDTLSTQNVLIYGLCYKLQTNYQATKIERVG